MIAKIAYANLRAEMSREGISVKDIAATLSITRDTAGRKLSRKSPLMLDEAIAIRNAHFATSEIEYLFAELYSANNNQAS